MSVKFAVNKESLERVILPERLYELEVMSLTPTKSAKGTSTNLNGRFQVISRVSEYDPEIAAKRIQVFDSLNTAFGVGIQDFVHACGMLLDDDGNVPGDFDGPSEDKLKYSGPLLGMRFKAELVIISYNGQLSNKIKSYVCAVKDCAQNNPKIKHATNLVRES